MTETYEPGELFVYMNGDHWELGEVKSANNTGTGYFCWYSMGDTAANTPTSHMHKLANAGWSHIDRLRDESAELRELVRDMARAWWACDNERCPHGLSCDAAVSEGKLVDCEMERRMAELGIEVDA